MNAADSRRKARVRVAWSAWSATVVAIRRSTITFASIVERQANVESPQNESARLMAEETSARANTVQRQYAVNNYSVLHRLMIFVSPLRLVRELTSVNGV